MAWQWQGAPWQQTPWRPKPPSVPTDFELDKEKRYKGTVTTYFKWKGYGFITPEEKGVVPGDKIYVHWSNIQTDDRYPFLNTDMEVEFGLMKWKDYRSNGETLRAKTVTAVGGAYVAVQDSTDAKKEFIGSQVLRYTGTLKFYNPQRGFGYVTMDDGYTTPETVPKELKVEESEINCAGKRPRKELKDVGVEFGIVKNRKGVCMVYNMTLPGGAAITEETLENRQVVGEDAVRGKVEYWNRKQGWGFILADASVTLPESVTTKLQEMVEATKAKGKPVKHEKCLYFRKVDVKKGAWVKQDLEVNFRLYTDDKGAGACDISEVEAQA